MLCVLLCPDYCDYNELPLEVNREYLDHAVGVYFTALKGE